MHTLKLNQLSFTHKLILSFFVLVMGYAYLFAQINLQLNTRDADGDAKGLASIKDIVITYHGDRTKTRLGVMINGPMREHLPTEADKVAIEEWIAAGRTREGYEDVQYIFQDNCVRCHPYDERPDYPLETYEEVYASAEPDKGPSIASLARFTHFHAFGMGIFSLLLSLVFSFSSFSPPVRTFVGALPFVAMLIDITSWWMTKLISSIFAYTVFLGGALMGLAFALIIFGTLYDMWLRKSPTAS
jgi:hypothetical protein